MPTLYRIFGILHYFIFSLFLHLSYPNQTGEIWKRQLTFVFEQGRRAGSTSRPRARENRTETISRVYRILPHPIYTMYISRDFQLPFLSTPHPYTKSVKSVYSSRILRASQSLYQVEKQPNSTPDMLNPPRQ